MLVVRGADGKLRADLRQLRLPLRHALAQQDQRRLGRLRRRSRSQKNHPGAIALTSIGCGADANPTSGVTGDKVDVAAEQGKQIAAEVDRAAQAGALADRPARSRRQLNRSRRSLFDTPPTREQWEETRQAARTPSATTPACSSQARPRRDSSRPKLSYPIQTWTFGDQLAMVFLPGEVVVDYSLRLKREFDRTPAVGQRLRQRRPVLHPVRAHPEGRRLRGRRRDDLLRPPDAARRRRRAEDHRRGPPAVARRRSSRPRAPKASPPKSPEQSLRSIRTKPGLEVELVAAEPLVTSPVAIDWAADGRLWVCEMFDYPTGVDGNWQPGGRVQGPRRHRRRRPLRQGRPSSSTTFPFPTGVTAWGNGVLVCAAPDILYAEDTDGDGKADKVEKLFTGFATDNYQARVNSLALGLDNWIYGANGLLGGVDHRRRRGKQARHPQPRLPLPLRRTARWRPSTGLTQQGRVRDDWGHWFGCDNSTRAAATTRTRSATSAATRTPRPAADRRARQAITTSAASIPISRHARAVQRPRATPTASPPPAASAIYRDTLLGDAYYGNAFTCEPVHNLVHRMILDGDDAGAARAARAPTRRESEFLASTDNWFRPVQVRTGPGRGAVRRGHVPLPDRAPALDPRRAAGAARRPRRRGQGADLSRQAGGQAAARRCAT